MKTSENKRKSKERDAKDKQTTKESQSNEEKIKIKTSQMSEQKLDRSFNKNKKMNQICLFKSNF